MQTDSSWVEKAILNEWKKKRGRHSPILQSFSIILSRQKVTKPFNGVITQMAILNLFIFIIFFLLSSSRKNIRRKGTLAAILIKLCIIEYSYMEAKYKRNM